MLMSEDPLKRPPIEEVRSRWLALLATLPQTYESGSKVEGTSSREEVPILKQTNPSSPATDGGECP